MAGALKDTFVIAAATISNLPEASKLRPWLFALARNESRRRIRPTSAVRAGEPDAAVQPAEEAAVELSDAGEDLSDATMQFRVVGRPPAAGEDLSDAKLQFGAISQSADPITPFRVIGQPTGVPGHVHDDQGRAELRSLIHSILAGLKPGEREVIELNLRHDLHDDDLAIALGMPQSRADDLAARARGRLEEALSALHIALTGREACPILGELLANWDGQLTEQTHDLVVWHIRKCQTCAHHGWGAMRPAGFVRLLPLASLPDELREQVLSLGTSTAEEAAAYRRRVARRADRIWFARFSLAIRRVSWNSIRAHPGVAVAAVAVAAWVLAAVSVTMITLGGSRAADVQTTTVPSHEAATSPAPSRSTSSSPRPPKSPKPSRSG